MVSRAQNVAAVSAAIGARGREMAREHPGVYAYETKQGTGYR
jgi:hypothetical protein